MVPSLAPLTHWPGVAPEGEQPAESRETLAGSALAVEAQPTNSTPVEMRALRLASRGTPS